MAKLRAFFFIYPSSQKIFHGGLGPRRFCQSQVLLMAARTRSIVHTGHLWPLVSILSDLNLSFPYFFISFHFDILIYNNNIPPYYDILDRHDINKPKIPLNG